MSHTEMFAGSTKYMSVCYTVQWYTFLLFSQLQEYVRASLKGTLTHMKESYGNYKAAGILRLQVGMVQEP